MARVFPNRCGQFLEAQSHFCNAVVIHVLRSIWIYALYHKHASETYGCGRIFLCVWIDDLSKYGRESVEFSEKIPDPLLFHALLGTGILDLWGTSRQSRTSAMNLKAHQSSPYARCIRKTWGSRRSSHKLIIHLAKRPKVTKKKTSHQMSTNAARSGAGRADSRSAKAKEW